MNIYFKKMLMLLTWLQVQEKMRKLFLGLKQKGDSLSSKTRGQDARNTTANSPCRRATDSLTQPVVTKPLRSACMLSAQSSYSLTLVLLNVFI